GGHGPRRQVRQPWESAPGVHRDPRGHELPRPAGAVPGAKTREGEHHGEGREPWMHNHRPAGAGLHPAAPGWSPDSSTRWSPNGAVASGRGLRERTDAMRTLVARASRTATLLIAALAILTSGSAHAQRALSVATLAPAGSTWMRVLESANREIRRRTNRALGLQFYPGGVQGDESEVIHKMSTGRLDSGVVTAIGLGQIYRPVLAF